MDNLEENSKKGFNVWVKIYDNFFNIGLIFFLYIICCIIILYEKAKNYFYSFSINRYWIYNIQ